jgi:plasmid stabilization system protein ParE
MREFKVVVSDNAKQDIREAISYYTTEANKTVAKLFSSEIKVKFKSLKTFPKHSIRYNDVYCLPTNIFPYMIHFTINDTESLVYVHAVIHTSRNPNDTWIY